MLASERALLTRSGQRWALPPEVYHHGLRRGAVLGPHASIRLPTEVTMRRLVSMSRAATRGLPDNWGASAAEHNRPYLADELLTGPIRRLSRAVTAHAPAALTYRWLCQTAVAPYSYDWLDNLGCRSPQQLTPGAENLEIGQAVMVFELVDVQPGYQFTGRGLPRAERLFGPLAATYAVESVDSDSSRLICRLAVAEPSGLGRLRAVGLAWGDVVMMRRQLLNLAGLAERDAVTLTSRA